MSEPLTQNDVHVLENAANVFDALKRAAGIARETLAVQQSISDQRRMLDEGATEIAKRKAEALDLARLAVEAADAHRDQLKGYEVETETARRALVLLREEHAERMKAQEQEFSEARSALRKRHDAVVDAFQAEIERLKSTRDDLVAEVERLRARFK